MTVKYKTVITKAGAIKLAAATVPDAKKVNFTAMAIGDGGGTLPVPDASQTKLVNEVWRHTLNKISQDNKKQNYVIAELVIPPETGGFWMREMGLYDDTGTLIAVGNMAESYKPLLAEGSGRAQTVRMVIMVSDIESVELTIDTSTVMATQDYVDDKLTEHEQSRRHPDATLSEKGFTQLSSATDSTSETLAATPKAVKAVKDIADGKYTAQDATTTQKGIVQLSSATDSTSEALAATPKAVKAVKDIADGKYTAQDATTTQKGIVQLSSATDSTSESTAATPKAVKAANDNANSRVPEIRKVNGHALTDDVVVTSQDIFGNPISIPEGWDLNAIGSPGLYVQEFNQGAISGMNYPVALAGTLIITRNAGLTQTYVEYGSGTTYIRCKYGDSWSPWRRMACTDGEQFTGVLTSHGEVRTLSYDSYRMVGNTYGTFWRQDGVRLYLMLTNAGDPYGSWNSLRPFMVDLATGGVSIGGDVVLDRPHVNDWTYIDARYYTRAESNNISAAIYQRLDNVYDKGTSDARYSLKNTASMAASGWWQDVSTGMIYQWVQGAATAGSANVAVTFPRAFPNACLFASVSTLNINDNDSAEQNFQLVSKTNANCVVKPNLPYGDKGNVAALVWAVGY